MTTVRPAWRRSKDGRVESKDGSWVIEPVYPPWLRWVDTETRVRLDGMRRSYRLRYHGEYLGAFATQQEAKMRAVDHVTKQGLRLAGWKEEWLV